MRAAIRTLAALTALAVPGSASANEPWVTEFNDGLTLNVGAWDIAAGKDGNLWFTEELGNVFTRITPSAVLTDFPGLLLGGTPRGIAAGPDGNMWVVNRTPAVVGRITPGGQITEFTAGLPTGSQPSAITAGPDGN